MGLNKTIIISSDHNGLKLKNKIQKNLSDKFNFIDLGPNNNEKVDYTDYAAQLSNIISKKQVNYGILICGTGIGMSMTANKFENVRAAIVHNNLSAKNSKDHNNSNIICLGSWINKDEININLLNQWLNTKFGKGRHIKRVEKIEQIKNTEKIIFTNGVFDILHGGHIELLKFAKLLGKKLVVGLNSDNSVRVLKGKNRPINNQNDRKNILLQLNLVDEVLIFDEIKPVNLINKINPDIIVKGAEHTIDHIRKFDKIPSSIKIKIFPIKKGYSTTKTIKKINKLKSAKKKNISHR